MPLSIPPIPVNAGNQLRWRGLHGSALGLAASQAANQHDGLTLIVTEDSQAAYQLEEELKFYGAADETELLSLPDWETLPYDSFSPHQDIISQRLLTLYRLPQLVKGILITPISTLMHKLPPKQHLDGQSLMMAVGQTINTKTLRIRLDEAGYRHVETVFEHGEYTVRGSIIDIFPMGSTTPYRIELFDDEIETLRTFDPENQRSKDKVEKIELLPAKEFPLNDEAKAYFKLRFRELFDVDEKRCTLFKDVADGIAPPGIEYYLPLFFDHLDNLFNYLPENTLTLQLGQLEDKAKHFHQDVLSRYDNLRWDVERPIVEPGLGFLAVDEVFAALKKSKRITVKQRLAEKSYEHDFGTKKPQDYTIDAKAEDPLNQLRALLNKNQDRILIAAESAGRKEVLTDLFKRHNLFPKEVTDWQDFITGSDSFAITIAPISTSLQLAQPSLIVIAEPQLFGSRVMQKRRREKQQENAELMIKNLSELNEGAPVVHIDHGVGRYLGLQTLEVDNATTEFLCLQYADNAKLYVPVSALHLISRYSGSEDEKAPLHKLGNEQWQKTKRKAAEKVRDTAAELLNVYARREARVGYACDEPDLHYEQFANSFAFEETPDQETAIAAVEADMQSLRPMDRLICGDVGFGKTEVAMRAAFITVQNDKQVGILVPTTLLAQQHYESFKDRFADTAVTVEVLSRFKSASETKQILADAKLGKIDILIGTHKLIQGDLGFKDLGLVVIDEEHRFGVRHKEKLKSLRSEVDILTLTATPIPRTLNMAMSGMRDLSIIATPPAKRLSIKTFVRQNNDGLIKEAILRELLRGGQVYFLHNEVKTIDNTAMKIQELIPEARVSVGHGQMRERQLEQVMSDFYHKRCNVLVCSTIIETGIDVPNANTIIMDRADKLGLAQLHQLRGRVGRSHHQAYAYLLTPHPKAMTKDAQKRLEAITAANDLGAGFTLATHDLEIRGAGELLGDEQTGHIQNIGYALFMEMLERAVAAIKRGETPNLDQPIDTGSELNLHVAALIPDDYLSDVHTRLIMYKRIANAKNNDELRELQVEMIDRFGLLPEPIKNLFLVTELKLMAQIIGIKKLDAGDQGGRLEFDAHTKVHPVVLVQMVQSQPHIFTMDAGGTKLRFKVDLEDRQARFDFVKGLLGELLPPKEESNAA